VFVSCESPYRGTGSEAKRFVTFERTFRGRVQCGDFPHLLVYGPSGAGKKTRIMCLLRELYGPGVEKLRIEHQTIVAPSKKKIEINTIASNYHLEVNPSVLTSVCKKEGLLLPPELAKQISDKSGRNLRRALLMCEACRVQQYPFSADQDVPEPDWEVYLRETANAIVSQQSPQRYDGKCEAGLVEELLNNCDGQLKTEVAHLAAYYEHRLHLGSKAIYHLEAFVAKFMAMYKKFMEDGLDAMMF
ncbi:hypothetical protein GOODEAATRI_021529, partial [Goodea atripinnis]